MKRAHAPCPRSCDRIAATTARSISSGRSMRDGKVATITLEPPRAQESADVRVLCRAARPVSRRSSTRSDVKAVVIAGAGGNFCSGGDVHEIIGPLTKMATPELLEFTRMTGDLVKAMRALPAAHRRRRRRRLRRRRRDDGAGLRPALRHAGGEDRVPVRARRPRGLRHGRLHAAAAHHRPGPRGRAALHRPRDDAPRRAQRGDSSTAACRRRTLLGEAQALARELADGPTFAHGDDQEAAASGMGDGSRRARSRPRRRRRRSACRRRISAAPTTRSPRSRRRIRGQLSDRWRQLTWTAHISTGPSSPTRIASSQRARAWLRLAAARADPSRTRRRCRLPRAGARARAAAAGCATACPRPMAARCRRSTRARSASRARRWPTTTALPTSRSRCRAWAAARSRSPARRRSARAGCRRWRAATPSPRSRCRNPMPAPTSRP